MSVALVLVAVIAAGTAAGLVAFVIQPLWTRRLDLDERALALQERRSETITPPAIPPDLMRRIVGWQDETAQALERKVILDLYAECAGHPDPWASVRQHLPPLLPPSDDRAVEVVS